MIRNPFPGLASNAAPFFAMDEKEFIETLVDHGWSEAAAMTELEERRTYEKQFVIPEEVPVEPDSADPLVRALARRKKRVTKERDLRAFDPDLIEKHEEEPF